jgi:protein NrfD
MELTVTGVNALTSPHLNIWDWRVSLYLFLGGLSAGLAVMASVLHLRKGGSLVKDEAAGYLAPILVPVILGIGMLFIFLDLERKLNVYWLYLTVQPLSPMSWGSWGLLVFFPVSGLFALATLPDDMRHWLMLEPLKKLSEQMKALLVPLAVINFGMGIFIGIYTGVLLSSFVARPLWNSAILPVLFLTSALSVGAALMIMVARTNKVKLYFTKMDIWMIFAEMVILPLFFYGQYTSSGSHRESIMPFFSLSHEYFFYGFSMLVLFVVFPIALVLKMLEIKEEHGHTLTPMALLKMNLSAIIVLLGGLIIRLTFVYAGQLSKFS